jgi:hypothetical protein
MGIKVIPIKRFVRWLESKGLIHMRTDSSHDHYNYPERDPRRLTRNIVIRSKKDKDIPILHIHTNLRTLGISHTQFEKEIKEF